MPCGPPRGSFQRICTLMRAFALSGVIFFALAAWAAEGDGGSAPDKSAPAGHATRTDCRACHTPDGWTPATFAHERTGFVLEGRHRPLHCAACHGGDLAPAPGRQCAACHRDVHAGQFGAQCQGCHSAEGWNGARDAFAHRQTQFPLVGQHAFIPCEECHLNRRDKTFAGSAVACLRCHGNAYSSALLTTIDHQASQLSVNCQSCHVPWSFSGARLPQHEPCFPIARGDHRDIQCKSCHTALAGSRRRPGLRMQGRQVLPMPRWGLSRLRRPGARDPAKPKAASPAFFPA
jgi:hypothetical protein